MDELEPPRSPRVPAVVVRAGEGERIRAGAVENLFRLTGATTADRLGLADFSLPPDTVGARSHVHHAHDETFYVLSGLLLVVTDDGEATLGAGDVAHAPRGAAHGFRTGSEASATALCMYTPPGYEQYFRDVHAAAEAGEEITDGLLTRLRARYATEPA